MKLLLDTHVLLWSLGDVAMLAEPTRAAITDVRNEVFVSAASAWEIAIKRALGKLVAPEDLEAAIVQTGFRPLPITLAHARAAGALPAHHADPFDRMLVAQARSEDLTLVSSDRLLRQYPVAFLEA